MPRIIHVNESDFPEIVDIKLSHIIINRTYNC